MMLPERQGSRSMGKRKDIFPVAVIAGVVVGGLGGWVGSKIVTGESESIVGRVITGEAFDNGSTTTEQTRSSKETPKSQKTQKPQDEASPIVPLHVEGKLLVGPDNKPRFPLIDTEWTINQSLNREEIETLFKKRHEQGFTAVSFAYLMFPEPERATNVYGGKAVSDDGKLIIPDAKNIEDENSFEGHFVKTLKLAEKYNLQAYVFPAWSQNALTDTPVLNASNAEAYGKGFGELNAKHNVVLVTGGDDKNPHENIWNNLINGYKRGLREKGDNTEPIIMYHPNGLVSPNPLKNNKEITVDLAQTSHCFRNIPDEDIFTYMKDFYNQTTKPSFDSEPMYEGAAMCWENNGDSTAKDTRNAIYAGMLGSGGPAIMYGNDAVWRSNNDSGQGKTWEKSLDSEGANQMQYIRELREAFPQELIPEEDLIASGARNGLNRVASARTADKSAAIIYSPGTTEKFVVNASEISGNVVLQTYDPRTGEVGKKQEVSDKTNISVTPPNTNDIVYIVSDNSQEVRLHSVTS